MADTDTDTQIPNTADAIADLQRQLAQPAPTIPTGTPDDGTSPSWTGLLGRVLGGAPAGYQLRGGEADAAGNRALLNFGINMLLASGPHTVRPNVLSSLATGLQGAQESVGQDQRSSAALAGAQYQAAREGRQDQLARIKEAIPLLQMQAQTQSADVARRIAAGGGAPPNIGDVGADTYVGAIGGHEGTGQNPRSSAAGVGQFLDSTWNDFATANPQYFAGMSPDQILAAKKDPAFGAKVGPIAIEWLAKQNADELQRKGVTPNGPLLGIAHYLGAGSAGAIAGAPDNAPISAYVAPAAVKANPELANMTVGQMKARYANTPAPSFMKPAVAPGQASAPAMAPVGTQPANTPVTIPPAPGGAGAGARPALPPPEAPITPGAGGAQTAGPAVPTSGVIPQLSPEQAARSAADVNLIEQGMVARGADPTTLAPGSGSSPAPMPGAVVTAQATPPIVNPYGPDWKPTEIPIPNLPRYDPNLTPAQNASFDRQRQEAGLGLPGEVPAKLAAVEKARADAIAAKQKDAADAADVFRKEQAESQRGIAQHLWDQQVAQQKALQEQENARQVKLQEQENARQVAEQAAKTAAAQSDLTSRLGSRQKNLDAMDAEAKGSTDALHNLELTDTLSKAAGAASLLPANVRDWLVNTGAATPDQIQKWSAGAALEAANNRLIQSLKGTGFSRITNQDLTFLTNSSSGGLGTPEQFRDAKTAFLTTLLKRNNQFAAQVHNFVDAGMNLPQAHQAADEKLGPIIPNVPKPADIALKYGQSPNARTLWMFDNLEPGTFYKDERGRLRINTRSQADLRPPE